MAAIGEIFTRTAADQQFGAVLESVSISTITLKQLMTQTQKSLMFKIIDGVLYILDDRREVIYPSNQSVGAEVPFALYSLSIITDLLDQGDQSTTYVQRRSEVLTVTNGEYTMEVAAWCPPICSSDDET
jgi:hypothetical protein